MGSRCSTRANANTCATCAACSSGSSSSRSWLPPVRLVDRCETSWRGAPRNVAGGPWRGQGPGGRPRRRGRVRVRRLRHPIRSVPSPLLRGRVVFVRPRRPTVWSSSSRSSSGRRRRSPSARCASWWRSSSPRSPRASWLPTHPFLRRRPSRAPRAVSADRLLTVEEALDRVFAAIAGPTEPELAWLSEALGRVAAEPVASPISLPPWDNSAMDGYAIRAADVAAATEDAPVTLEVIGEVRAGQPPETTVRRGTAVRIATGAPVPAGRRRGHPGRSHDAARCDRRPGGRTRPGRDGSAAGADRGPRGRCRSVARSDAHGSDLSAGAPIIDAGTVVTPAVIGLAAGVGLENLYVHRRPHVSVLATGDEVRGRGSELGPAGIPDANGPSLMAMVEAAGGHPDDTRDRRRPLRRRPRAPVCGPGRRRRRHHRVGRRLGRAVRRRPDGVRGVRHDRSVAGRRPARASRSRSGPRGRQGTTAPTRTDRRRSSSGCRATRSRRS